MKKFFKFFREHYYVLHSLLFWVLSLFHAGQIEFWLLAGFAITFLGIYEIVGNIGNGRGS